MNNETDCILGVSDAPQSNPTAPQEPGDNSAESVLKATAYAILIIGIIASVIGMYILGSGWDGNPLAAFSVLCGGTAFATVIWASLMVVVNISTNIRAIKHRLQGPKKSPISQSSVSPSVCEDSASAITSPHCSRTNNPPFRSHL